MTHVKPDRRPACRRLGLACLAFAGALGLLPAPGTPSEGPGVPLRLGVIAEEPNEPDRMLEVFSALIGLLRERLRPAGVPVGPLVIARDLDDLSQRLVRGD